MSQPTPIPRPNVRLLPLEGRALFELAALVPAYPFLRRAPVGDGHPVLVLPGFMAGDFSTRALRRFLRDKGYRAHGWKQGRNLGPSEQLIAAMAARLQELHGRYDRRVSLIGWSLGGIYARELARGDAGVGAPGDHPGQSVSRPRRGQRAALSAAALAPPLSGARRPTDPRAACANRYRCRRRRSSAAPMPSLRGRAAVPIRAR